MAGQMFDLHPGCNQKACLTANQRQPRSARLCVPADELIPGSTFPCSGSENTATQNSPLPVPCQVLQILSHRAGIGQIMMFVKQASQRLAVVAISTDLLDSHWLQLLQPLSDRQRVDDFGQVWQDAHPVWAAPPARWQLDEPALLQLQEQGAGSHVFELTHSITPMPLQSQLPGQAPAAPLRMLIKKMANLAQSGRID